MASIAIFNSKGGVGKSTLAINLAWEAAASGLRTLLWEIDEQGDSSWILHHGQNGPADVDTSTLMHGIAGLRHYVKPTTIPGLSLVSGDKDLRRTDNFFVAFFRQQRLSHLFADLESDFDLVILDCSPGFTEANRKILLAVSLVIVPTIPSPFSMRGMNRIRDFLVKHRGHYPPMLPVFSMVDRRRTLHKAALADYPAWPVIAMSSEIEQMTIRRAPIATFAPKGPAATTFHDLWEGISQKLSRMRVIRARRASMEAKPPAVVTIAPPPAAPVDRPGARPTSPTAARNWIARRRASAAARLQDVN